MLVYNRYLVNFLILLEFLVLGLCGTYFNVFIIGFVCVGYYFRSSIAQGRRVYPNLHTTYVFFIVMCCAVSFVLQSSAVALSARKLAFAKDRMYNSTCPFASVQTADELVLLKDTVRECGLKAYARVAINASYDLIAAPEKPILFQNDISHAYQKSCSASGLVCFNWCVQVQIGVCHRPTWPMVKNIRVSNARGIYVAVDRHAARIAAWGQLHVTSLRNGAQLHTHEINRVVHLQTHIDGVLQIDQMNELYMDEFLVIEPLDAARASSITVTLSQQCIEGTRSCKIDKTSFSASIARLARSASIAPYTIIAVASRCSESVDSMRECEWRLPTLLGIHALNTLALLASIYVALLSHAQDNNTSPVVVILVVTSLITMNWVAVVLLAYAQGRVRVVSIQGIFISTLQLAQICVLVYELSSVRINGLKYSETHWAVQVLAPCTMLWGPVFATTAILCIATTLILLVDSLKIVHLYPR